MHCDMSLLAPSKCDVYTYIFFFTLINTFSVLILQGILDKNVTEYEYDEDNEGNSSTFSDEVNALIHHFYFCIYFYL